MKIAIIKSVSTLRWDRGWWAHAYKSVVIERQWWDGPEGTERTCILGRLTACFLCLNDKQHSIVTGGKWTWVSDLPI